MTAYETVMLIHLLILSGDKQGALHARADYLCSGNFMRRFKKLDRLLTEAEIQW